jgi:hypothetical protein
MFVVTWHEVSSSTQELDTRSIGLGWEFKRINSSEYLIIYLKSSVQRIYTSTETGETTVSLSTLYLGQKHRL